MEQLCYGCMRMKRNSPQCELCGYVEGTQNAPNQLPVGTILMNQYVIGKVLGQGGFGITYIGYDRHLGVRYAIKEYYPTTMATRTMQTTVQFTGYGGSTEDYMAGQERFLREARSLAQLQNIPGIAQVHNYFQANGTAYIVMEYVQGMTLTKYIAQQGGQLSVQAAMGILESVMNTLELVHQAGIVHRDISPDNIMIQPDGRVRLVDFGTAKKTMSQDDYNTTIIRHGFAPIEQYQTQGNIGDWTDLYALCATFYYCLTGKRPESAMASTGDVSPIPWQSLSALTSHQQAVFQKATAPRSAMRYPTIAQFREALHGKTPGSIYTNDDHAPAPEWVHTDTRVQPPKPEKKKKKFPLWIPIVGAVAALGLFLLPGGDSKPDSDPTDAPQPTENHISVPANVSLMAADFNPGSSFDEYGLAPVFGNEELTRNAIYTVTFRNSLDDAPSDSWDISEAKDGSILAWVKPAETDPASLGEISGADETRPMPDQLYNLYLAAEGGVYAPKSSIELFLGYQNVTEFRFNGNFHTEYTTNMELMFGDCERLNALDLSGFDTQHVTDMGYMFSDCYSLTELDLSGCDTSKVKNFSGLLNECYALENVNLRGLNTQQAQDLSWMFSECYALTKLDVTGFDTSNVESMKGTFDQCTTLTELDVTGFDTSKVQNMAWMFSECYSLEELDVSGFDTAQVTDMHGMFEYCSSLTELDVSGFDTANVTDMHGMFQECEGLTELDVSGFDTSKATDMMRMFSSCSSLTELDVSGFDTAQVTNMYSMFSFCYALEGLDVSGFDTSKVTDMAWMFSECNLVPVLDVSGFDTSNVTDMHRMFDWCESVTELDLSGFDTSKVTDMNQMFQYCTSLEKLDVSSFDTSLVTDMTGMFNACNALEALDVSGFDTSNVTDMSWMFSGCHLVPELDVSGFDTSNVTAMEGMFDQCRSVEELYTGGFDTSNITDMSFMFSGCTNLRSLGLSTWDFSNVTEYTSFLDEDITFEGEDWHLLFE